ncbi:hypothetical protein AB838_01105 [Rhodobacteraceae bacterium (ex Bugula neritina AB1)]|nr:hypothetical protein AB838_01105 [Rhodobacteraceae bacterium (ex Bugula neritina AB1)]
MSDHPSKSLLFVQNGDYRDAYMHLKEGGSETYRDQKRSVDYVAGLAREAKVTTLALSKTARREELAPNLWAAGLSYGEAKSSAIAQVFEEAEPTHVLLRTPHFGFLREARRRNVHILPNFADIFERGGPRTAMRNFRMRRELLKSKAPCFCNHSLNASRSLIDVLGLPPEKVMPWDWSKVPVGEGPRKAPPDKTQASAFFAGALSEEKGVGDCLKAVAVLKAQGIRLEMRFAGPGDIAFWQERSRTLDIADRVVFLGMIANGAVREEMSRHDFVIVPSRPAYAEGLPNTIYEALASRSVLILSDHPAFTGRLTADEEALIFKAADPNSLAQSIAMVLENGAVYENISENSAQAHDRLYIGMEWTSLVDAFLADPEDRLGWVARNNLQYWQSKQTA